MENVKQKVLEKIKEDLDKQSQNEFSWDSLIEWFAYVRALSDFKLLNDEELKEISDFIHNNSI